MLKRIKLLWILAFAALLIGCNAAQTAVDLDFPPEIGEETEDQTELLLLHVWPQYEGQFQLLADSVNETAQGYVLRIADIESDRAEDYVRAAVASDDMADLFAAPAPLMESFLQLDGGKTLRGDPLFENEAMGIYLPEEEEPRALVLFEDSVVLLANLDLLKENQLETPRDMIQLQKCLSVLKQAGVGTPLAVSSRPNGGQLIRLSGCITDGFLLRENCARDDTKAWSGAVARGAAKAKEWAQAGYFGSNFFTRTDEKALTLFRTGNSPFLFCTAGQALKLENEDLGFEAKLMAFPGTQDAQQAQSLNSRPASIAVSASCQSEYAQDALFSFADALADEETLRGEGWIAPRPQMRFEGQTAAQQLWQLLCEEVRPAGRSLAEEENEQKGQLFVEYLTSNMTSDAYERSLGQIYGRK